MNRADVFHAFSRWAFFTSSDVVRLLNIPMRKVLTLIEQDLVIPKNPSLGRGSSRHYTPADLIVFMVFNRLNGMGIAPRFLRSIAPKINNIIRSGRLPSQLHITKGEGQTLHVGDSAYDDIVLTVPLSEIEKEVFDILYGKVPKSTGKVPKSTEQNQPANIISLVDDSWPI